MDEQLPLWAVGALGTILTTLVGMVAYFLKRRDSTVDKLVEESEKRNEVLINKIGALENRFDERLDERNKALLAQIISMEHKFDAKIERVLDGLGVLRERTTKLESGQYSSDKHLDDMKKQLNALEVWLTKLQASNSAFDEWRRNVESDIHKLKRN